MVEAVPEQNDLVQTPSSLGEETPTNQSTPAEGMAIDQVPKRPRRHFWTGTKLPSMGCFITIFSFLDYGAEMKMIVCKLCRAGTPFFYTHLDNEQVM